ncbi:MAG: transglutaminase domain-containing protein, partial [Fibrobacter sp.]|nr:transglutaminase domain-containing protein [Fibrobacter sp.]
SNDEQTVLSNENGIISVHVKKLNLNPQTQYPLVNVPPEMKEYLEPTRIIESTDSIVVRLARKITKRSKTAEKVIQKINRTVRWYITPALDVQYATAGEVARSRRGDCTEYAVLTSALCRASGIPSRIVNGISYLPVAHSFYFHAWAQVFIDGKWISIDPAMRRFEPGHIAISFSKDGQPSFTSLNAIGNIQIVSIEAH